MGGDCACWWIIKGGWSGVDVPDVLGVWTVLEEVDDGACGVGGRGCGDGGAPGGACMWIPFVTPEAPAATAVGGVVALMLLLAVGIPLLLLLPVELVELLLVALPLEDLKEDKRFCAEDLRRIKGRRMGLESEVEEEGMHTKGNDPIRRSNQAVTHSSLLTLVVDMADINTIAQQFTTFYYQTFDVNRSNLASLYVCPFTFSPPLI